MVVKQTSSQILGREGERWFEAKLPPEWAYDPPRTDLGLDGRVSIGNSSHIGGRQFGVQIKASRRFRPNTRGYFSVAGVSRSTILYWISALLPTLIVLYDAQDRTGFYSWVPDALPDPESLFLSSRKEVSLRIPARQVLDDASWRLIERDVSRHYSWVASLVAKARSSDLLLPTLNSLAKATRGLTFVEAVSSRSRPMDDADDEKMKSMALSVLELSSHREALCGLQDLQEILMAHEPEYILSRSGAAYYRELLKKAYHPFDDALRKRNDAFAVWSNPEEVFKARMPALALLNELMVQLTGGGDTPDASITDAHLRFGRRV